MRLDRFVLLNYTGFVKIVKKHDRVTGQSARPWLLLRLSSSGSFVQQRFDQARAGRAASAPARLLTRPCTQVVTALSDAYASVRARRAGAALKAGAWVPPSNFERSTTKYWVAPEDVLAVKVRRFALSCTEAER